MLNVLIPAPLANIGHIPDAMQSVVENTDFPLRFVVIVDGGIRKDLVRLESFLAEFGSQWRLLHNDPDVGLNRTIQDGIDVCAQRMVLFMAPQVRLFDKNWFGKVKQIFDRDPACAVVDTSKDSKSATLHPMRREVSAPRDPGCSFAVLSSAFATAHPPMGDADPVQHWSRAAMKHGCSSWAAPGVRYTEVECHPHELWRAPLASR